MGTFNLVYLVLQEIQLPFVGHFAFQQAAVGVAGIEPGAVGCVIGGQGRGILCKGIEQAELALLRGEGTVFLRVVHIDQTGADALEQLQGDGAAVDELAVAGGGDHAADDEQSVLTGRHAAFLQLGIQGAGILQLEHGLNAALRFPAADEALIGAFTQGQGNAAHDDGFAGTGFAGDAQKARVGFPGQFIYQSQIPYLEQGKHNLSLRYAVDYAIMRAEIKTKNGC